MFLDSEACEIVDLGAVLRALTVVNPSKLHLYDGFFTGAVPQFTDHQHKAQQRSEKEASINIE
jgi:hypothetical protein